MQGDDIHLRNPYWFRTASAPDSPLNKQPRSPRPGDDEPERQALWDEAEAGLQRVRARLRALGRDNRPKAAA